VHAGAAAGPAPHPAPREGVIEDGSNL